MSNQLKEHEVKLNVFLKEVFQKHGVECELEDNILIFSKEQITAHAKIFDMSSTSTKLLQLDVLLEIGLGKEIVESCVGIGMDIDSAIADAWKNFLSNTFHVLLAAFFIPEDKEQVNCYQWNISGRSYNVTESQMTFRGQVPEPLPMKWYDDLENLIRKQNLSPGTHWVRLYYAQSEREMISCEILLDNYIWKSIENEVRGFDFPKSRDFLSLRIFMVLQDGLDVSRAAAIMGGIDTNDQDEEIISKQLVKNGMSPVNAEKAEILIPLAFGRVFLSGMTTAVFSDEATITNDAKQEININLNDEPLYTEAYMLAERIMAGGPGNREHFQSVLVQSSEFNAFNNALNEGAQLEDLNGANFSPPMIYLPNYKPEEKFISIPDKENEETEKKASWKFWKKKK